MTHLFYSSTAAFSVLSSKIQHYKRRQTDMAGPRVLVTGARGFIGGFLCKRLLVDGYAVSAMATSENHTRYLRDLGMDVRVGDLTRPATIKGICDGVDIVIHLAARVGYQGTRKQFYDEILEATRHLLDESVGKVSRFVYTSSFCASGAGGVTYHMRGHREDDPEEKTGIFYGDAKYDTEKLVFQYHRDKGLVSTVVRPSNVIGPGSVWVDGMAAMMLARPIFPLIDGGRHSASLVYIDNLVDGIMLASTKEAAAGKTYHFRDDYEVTWKTYFSDIASAAGANPRFLRLPFPVAWALASFFDRALRPLGVETEITRQVIGQVGRDHDVDTSRAKRDLGWHTRVPYEEGIAMIREHVKGLFSDA
jgi:nucleoside-diphosphate-sugar epimerase